MHTVWVRLNAVVFFGLTVLLGLSCLAAFSKIGHSYIHQPGKILLSVLICFRSAHFYLVRWLEQRICLPYFVTHFVETDLIASSQNCTVIHKLELNTLRSLKSHGGVDRALLSFDIDADMKPAFHWNVKQLFVYVVASYETSSKVINDVVIWDKIIENIDSDEKKHIQEENVFVKYALVDQGNELRGKDVTLKLMWDHMPITGFVYMDGQEKDTTTSFELPVEYK